MSDVAVVVLNLNGRHLLDDCLTSLEKLTVPADVVVADNGSTDDSVAYLRPRFPQVRVLELGRNLGFAAGYNRALAEVACPWVALLNNDAVLEPGWIEHLLAFAAHEPRAAILGGKLLFSEPVRRRPEESERPNGETPARRSRPARREAARARQAGQALSSAQGGNARSTRTVQSAGASFTEAGTAFEIGWGQADAGQYDRPARVGAIPGAAMLIRRNVFLDLGGFAADYHAYLEDVDLCWRAWLTGREVHYVPKAVAFHRYGSSGGGRASPFRIKWMQRNRLANMIKNLERGTLPKALGISLAYDVYRMLEFAARGQFGALRALAAGSLAFRRDLRLILAQRTRVQMGRSISDRALRDAGLLAPALTAFREYRRSSRVTLPQGKEHVIGDTDQ